MNTKKKNNTKDDRLKNNYLGVVRQFVTGKGYSAMTRRQLCDRLGIATEHHRIITTVLKDLEKEGLITEEAGRYFPAVAQESVVTGILSTHPRGFGFVKPDNAGKVPGDIFIPKNMIWNAVDGDHVEVSVDWENVSQKGPEGEIIGILKRGRTHLAGTVTKMGHGREAWVHAPLLGAERGVRVTYEAEESLRVGDRIIMKVIEWHNQDEGEPTHTQLTRVIGNIDDPSCDVEAAIQEFELAQKFTAKVLAQAKAIGTRVKTSDMKDREDLRDLECVTIDPDTAMDFDDAVSVEKDKHGNYHLGVHIADVSHYVIPGSPIDKEAIERCNSTYFPGTVVPMLPHELSNHLCSLRPNVNRLAASVLMTIDGKTGELLNYRMTRSVIKSRKRFTYREAKAVIEGKKKSPHSPLIARMVELCGVLRKLRFKRGSLDLSLPEAVVLVDEDGVPTGIDYVEYDITHQMIEEFMLKANEIVAKHLSEEQQQLIFRIHQEPSDENLRGFVTLAHFFGYTLSNPPTVEELQKLFDEAHGSAYGQYLASNYIRCMKMAFYSPDNVGHFGLSLEHYCHFTSPIRRYADLVVHRVLFGEKIGRPDLEKIATALSEQERVSSRAENSVKLLKKLRLLQARQKADPYAQYEAVVTSVKPFGVAFDIPSMLLDGFIHVREMGGDFYNYDTSQQMLVGQRGGARFQAGTPLTVMLTDLNLITQEVKWDVVPDSTTEERKDRKPKQHRRHERKRGGRRKR